MDEGLEFALQGFFDAGMRFRAFDSKKRCLVQDYSIEASSSLGTAERDLLIRPVNPDRILLPIYLSDVGNNSLYEFSLGKLGSEIVPMGLFFTSLDKSPRVRFGILPPSSNARFYRAILHYECVNPEHSEGLFDIPR